ncbi:MAG: hypothetical protein JOZ90_00340 [Alphaproteobacteria bacterium]|nr:hypothetical protein [Alphaproteobacteria bacterium]MBV9370983.1 hypothetical protein [Alphaproteobacteria bacterium]MBV9899526.1 hypothetical protein [Alphaproteobacteria bacterium]
MARLIVPALAALALLAGCAGGPGLGYYTLIQPGPRGVVQDRMVVTPGARWNRAPRGASDIEKEEDWTLNGPLLDSLTFIAGLEDGKRIVRQRSKADRKVPDFRSDMVPQDVAAMVETFYRVRAGASEFTLASLKPRDFLGRPGFQFDYDYLGGDEVRRRGRAVGAIIEGRFYLALFDAARMHYFDAGLPEFERLVDSARLGRRTAG